MTYKFKSFLYFLCFAIAAFIYNNIEEEDKRFQDQVSSSSVVETDLEDVNKIEESPENHTDDLE